MCRLDQAFGGLESQAATWIHCQNSGVTQVHKRQKPSESALLQHNLHLDNIANIWEVCHSFPSCFWLLVFLLAANTEVFPGINPQNIPKLVQPGCNLRFKLRLKMKLRKAKLALFHPRYPKTFPKTMNRRSKCHPMWKEDSCDYLVVSLFLWGWRVCWITQVFNISTGHITSDWVNSAIV